MAQKYVAKDGKQREVVGTQLCVRDLAMVALYRRNQNIGNSNKCELVRFVMSQFVLGLVRIGDVEEILTDEEAHKILRLEGLEK